MSSLSWQTHNRQIRNVYFLTKNILTSAKVQQAQVLILLFKFSSEEKGIMNNTFFCLPVKQTLEKKPYLSFSINSSLNMLEALEKLVGI